MFSERQGGGKGGGDRREEEDRRGRRKIGEGEENSGGERKIGKVGSRYKIYFNKGFCRLTYPFPHPPNIPIAP